MSARSTAKRTGESWRKCSSVVFAPSARSGRAGHILFVRENTLMALPFDAASAQASGDVFPVAEGVSVTTDGFYVPSSVSENGVLLYEAGGATGGNQLGWYDRTGKSLGPAVASGGVFAPAISPDEKSVVFRRMAGGVYDLWVRDLSRGTETRITSDASGNATPFWSPKGDRIVFTSNRKGAFNLYQKAASGTGQDELLLPNSVTDFATQWSRDGRFIVYIEQDPKNKYDLWVSPGRGRRGPQAHPISADRVQRIAWPDSRRTATGWPSPRTARGGVKCMSGRFLAASASGPFRSAAASSRAGGQTVKSCSLKQRTGR